MSDAASGPALHPALHTRFCDLVGCRYPIVQTGMGWVSGASLTAATSCAGGFGILAAVTMTADQLAEAIGAVKERTAHAFGVNLRADQPDLADRIELCVREGVRLVSFAGAPTKDAIAELHGAGVLVMPTVGARRHAEKMAEWGVDAVIAQGAEGGGHTGVVPTSLLLPQVVDAVGSEIPVLAAGGFYDGRGLVAALAWGADGVAMGTRFLLTRESRVPDAIKRPLVVFGRAPFAFYVAHLYVIHTLAVIFGVMQGFDAREFLTYSFFFPKGYGVGLPGTYAVWLLVVAALYPLCEWVAAVKSRRQEWWLSYL